MNIGSKFILSIVSIATLAVASTAIVIASLSSDKTEDVLLDARRDQMISLRNVATEILQQYFTSLENQILSISQQQAVIDATRNLSSSYKPFAFFVGRNDRQGQKNKLRQYYSKDVATEFNRLNPGTNLDFNAIINSMGDPAIALQTQYIAKNPNALNNKDNMLVSSDKTSYTANHKRYHPYFQASLKRFNLQDIFLLDDNGHVVYSVKKHIDFGISVSSPLFAKSGLAKAFHQANKLKESHYAFVDYEPYLGFLGLPTGFLSAPIYEKEKRIGVVVFALSSAKLTELMTYGYNWKASGLGQTGETYLISRDHTPRSASRLLLEKPDEFASQVRKLNYPQQEINKILATKTNVAFHTIKSQAINDALNGNSGTIIENNYLNKRVLTAYTPVNIMGEKWALLNEIEMVEVTSKLSAIQKFILAYAGLTAVVVIVLGGIAGLIITRTIVRPIRETSHSLIDIAEGEGDLTSRLNDQRKDELGELATGFNQFVGKIHQLVQGIKGTVESLTTTVDNMKQVAEEGSDNVNAQQKETEMVVTAINQMAASAQEIAGNAINAAEVANNADTEGKHVQTVVQNAITSIENLSEEIDQASVVISELEGNVGNIVSILDVIRGIADQTNLLALNAAIESARAGEHGRGFAVVADEVRALAKKTQDSTEEIQEMIERLQKDSVDAVRVMDSSKANGEKSADIARTVGTSLLKIAEAISMISDMNTQIASASDEQKVAIEEINRSMVEISHSGKKTLSGVNSITENSSDLRELSNNLEEKIKQFKV
ncbi:methyl-accepting chemotaxis protein [Vibrio salinus]|uniref:methyl-accepting chemotaxis protein n=1 Tax=Vibrio salinus TaxID=2899784 RepID=UPI001E2A96A2|nr:methyl-accepting chemotaxis protein [Vibrio salinus]MCE0495609.1 methyl-accepting chemotaxis protein [Vibrio salinus]